MAATKGAERPLRFRGIPVSLTGVVPDRRDAAVDVQVFFRRPEDPDSVEVAVYHDVDPRIIRLSLPPEVRPGTYEGTLHMGQEERAAELEVEAAPGLRVVPEQLRFEARPGDLVGADLTLLNTGNVPVRLRPTQVFGSFMEGGVERALHQAYISNPAKGGGRMEVLTHHLARAHPDLIKMKIQKGAGDIAPGEMCDLYVTLEIPGDVEPGKTYRGNWELANLVYPVTYTVLDDGVEDSDDVDGREPGARPPKGKKKTTAPAKGRKPETRGAKKKPAPKRKVKGSDPGRRG